jgi:uncharacterized protein YdaU (DUF1376 family)
MAKDPAFLFYYQDFLVGTDELKNEEIGAYIRCLCIQAAKGGISVNHMIKICESQQIQNVIKKKFVWYPEEGVFRNGRLSEEIEKRKKYCESRGNNKKGKKHIKIISKSYDLHMENEDENEIEDENVLKKEGVGENSKTQKKNVMSTAKDTKDIPLPFKEPTFAVIWAEWLQYRRESRFKAFTPTGLKRTFNKLLVDSGGDCGVAIEMIDNAMAKCWQGIHPLKQELNATSHYHARTVGQTIKFD